MTVWRIDRKWGGAGNFNGTGDDMNRKLVTRIVVVALIVGLIVLFKALGLGEYFTLSYIKARQGQFMQMYQANPALVLGSYFAVYVAVTALSLPAAAVLTLLGGALFGFWATLVAVSFASTIGATLACAAARFVLREWVQDRFGARLERINRGVEREGAFYLFTLRLVPLFPFWLINLAMGLTRMRMWTFYWVSQVGMLAGTAVYVNAGKQLGEIQRLGDVMSVELLVSFAILGIFPLAAKKFLDLYRKKTGRKAVEEIAKQESPT
ncbi:MAG: TVP38/TMEM64 family protein [Desulfatibacillaceae bacterium]